MDQYFPPLRDLWNDPATTPDELLLWFHHLPWDHRMKSGRTLWSEIVAHYRRGAAKAADFERRWASLAGRVDAERHAEVAAKLRRQAADAKEWAEKCVRYFQKFSQGNME